MRRFATTPALGMTPMIAPTMTPPPLPAVARASHLALVEDDDDVVNPPGLVCLGLDPSIAALCALGEQRMRALRKAGLVSDPDAIAARVAARAGLGEVPPALRYRLRLSARR